MEQKSLLPSKISSNVENNSLSNNRGRPTAENIVLFSPQPQSAVSLLLNKLKTEKCDIRVTIDVSNTVKDPSPEHDINKLPEDNHIVCKYCSHRCEDAKEMRTHKASHKQFHCDYPGCFHTCKLSSNLLKHKRVHTDDRPYLCDRCSFRTKFINSLKVHKRIHTSERPHSCKHCSYKCNSSSNLKKHCLHRHPEEIKLNLSLL